MQEHFWVVAFAASIIASDANAQSRDTVSLAQSYLNVLGYDAGTVDGLWGGKTERAITGFLDAQDLRWDGSLDQQEIGLLSSSARELEQFGLVSTEILGRNFCSAKDLEGSAYEAYLLNRRGEVRRFDAEDILTPRTLYYLDTPYFVTLNQKDSYFFAAAIDENEHQPNETLPVLIGAPHGSSQHLYGYGSIVGLEIEQANLSSIHEIDLDNDGDEDLVFVDYGEHDVEALMGGKIQIALFDENSNSYKVTSLNAPKQSNHRSVVVDIDRDGDLDIVSAGRIHGRDNTSQRGFVTVFKNDGFGKFEEDQSLLSRQMSRWFVDAADFNGDGFADIVLGGWGDVQHLILLDNSLSGRKIHVELPGPDQSILSMTTRKNDEVVEAYFFTTHDYQDFSVYRVIFDNEMQSTAEVVWTANRNDKNFGYATPNYIFGCDDGIYYFRQWPKNEYFTNEGGFTLMMEY